MSEFWLCAFAVVWAASPVLARDAVTLTPATSAANAPGLSQILNPSFAGMGIEPSNLFSFTGGESTNQFSVNLFRNLANYTGVPPHLRIGGNTQDNMIYNASMDEYYLYVNPNPTGQGAVPSDHFWFGPRYFEVLDRFPSNTPITYGLNLAYEESDYLTHIVEEASAAVTMLKNVNLVSFEIGNEPDLWLANGFRTGSWNNSDYASQWRTRAEAVYEQVLVPNNLPSAFFEPGCTASTIGTYFMVTELAQTSITAAVDGTSDSTFVAGWNQHDYYYYIGVSGYALTLDIMLDLSTTAAQFVAWVTQTQQAFATGKPYYLREMASVGPIGQTGISDVFGATLWQLNFFLYAATLNISSVQMHMTDNSFAAPWQPIEMYDMGPYVRTTYYAWAAMDQLIGVGCTTRVASLPISAYPENYGNRLTAYATYQDGKLAAVVLLNTLMSNASNTAKGSAAFNLSLPDYAGQTLYISYLTADGADSRFNTTWNGISFEQSGDGTPTIVDSTSHTITIGSDGSALVSVRDSQAVVANVGSVVGSGTFGSAAAAACSALASSTVEGSEALPSGAYSISAVTATATSSTAYTATAGSSGSGSTTSSGLAAAQATMPPMAGVVALGALAAGVVAIV